MSTALEDNFFWLKHFSWGILTVLPQSIGTLAGLYLSRFQRLRSILGTLNMSPSSFLGICHVHNIYFPCTREAGLVYGRKDEPMIFLDLFAGEWEVGNLEEWRPHKPWLGTWSSTSMMKKGMSSIKWTELEGCQLHPSLRWSLFIMPGIWQRGYWP